MFEYLSFFQVLTSKVQPIKKSLENPTVFALLLLQLE